MLKTKKITRFYYIFVKLKNDYLIHLSHSQKQTFNYENITQGQYCKRLILY